MGMTRKGWHVLGWGFMATILVTACTVNAKPDKDDSVKDIMGRLHKGDDAIRPTIENDLKADTLDWSAIQKLTKQYLDGAEAVSKKDPPLGEKDSWAKLTKIYIAGAKDLNDAAKQKDRAKTVAAEDKLGKSCGDCHTAHRPKKP
jgi:cytochrome c556